MRIALCQDVVIGRIAEHVVEVLRIIRIPPLFILSGSEREGLIKHRRRDINEWHSCDHRMEEIGTTICHCTYQQTSSTPPFGHQALSRGIALSDEGLCTSDEVGEGILLLEELPIFIPLLPEVTPPTHLSLYVDETAVNKAQDRDAEVCIERHSIAPIAIEQGGSRAVTLQSLAIEQRHRYTHTIWGCSPKTLYGIVLGAKATADLLLLEEATLPLLHIIFVE